MSGFKAKIHNLRFRNSPEPAAVFKGREGEGEGKRKGKEGERKEGIGEGPAPKYFGPEPHLSWWEIAER